MKQRVEITLTTRIFVANKGFEIRRIKLDAHVWRIRDNTSYLSRKFGPAQ